MKHYEELARLQVNERIQQGLKAQAVQRAISENKKMQPRSQYHPFAMKPIRWILVFLELFH